MRWIYLSPHFDDIALSCGGLVWEQVQAGKPVGMPVEIWTVGAGAVPEDSALSPFARSLHERWKIGLEEAAHAVEERRREDEAAGQRLGAQMRFWNLPDCIYRRLPDGSWLVNGEDDLWQPFHPQETALMERLADWLVEGLQPGDRLVSPMTLGNHVDHSLVRRAAERAAERAGAPLWFYADYPYAVRPGGEIEGKLGAGWQKQCFTVTREGLRAWQDAIACYQSQISTFWGGHKEMRSAIKEYWQAGGGTCLWERSTTTTGGRADETIKR